MEWLFHHGCREREVKFHEKERCQNILKPSEQRREGLSRMLLTLLCLGSVKYFCPSCANIPHFNLRRFNIYELLKWRSFMSEDKTAAGLFFLLFLFCSCACRASIFFISGHKTTTKGEVLFHQTDLQPRSPQCGHTELQQPHWLLSFFFFFFYSCLCPLMQR